MIEKIKKVLELSKRGVGGEKIAAQERLEALLKKHNVTLEDLERDAVKERDVPHPKDPQAERLVCQIAAHVLPKERYLQTKFYTLRGGERGSVGIVVLSTEAEHIEIKELFEWHWNQYKKDRKITLDRFHSAYIQKHNIFPAEPINPEQNIENDFNEQMKILSLSKSLSDDRFQKSIEQ